MHCMMSSYSNLNQQRLTFAAPDLKQLRSKLTEMRSLYVSDWNGLYTRNFLTILVNLLTSAIIQRMKDIPVWDKAIYRRKLTKI